MKLWIFGVLLPNYKTQTGFKCSSYSLLSEISWKRLPTHAHTQTQLSWDVPLLLFHSSLRQPIKSFRWWARPRLYLTNEGWRSGWRIALDDQLQSVSSCKTWVGANMSLSLHLSYTHTPPFLLSLFFISLFSLLVPQHPRGRLIIIKESRVQRRGTLCTLSLSLFVTSPGLLNKWEYVLALANLSPLAQNGFPSFLLPPRPHSHSSPLYPLLFCFFSHSHINWIFHPWLLLLGVPLILSLFSSSSFSSLTSPLITTLWSSALSFYTLLLSVFLMHQALICLH